MNGATGKRNALDLLWRRRLSDLWRRTLETGARAARERLVRLTSGFQLCTLKGSVRAQVQARLSVAEALGLSRCPRMDLDRNGTISQILTTLGWTQSYIPNPFLVTY